MKTKIFASFPGTGKSYYVANLAVDIKAVDLDSNDYTYGYDQKGNALNNAFPGNYFASIIQVLGECDFLFVGCQPKVLNLLLEEDLPVTLIYPERQLKDEYLERFKKRGDSKVFIDLMDKNWDKFLDYLEAQNCERIVLARDQHISEVINLEYF